MERARWACTVLMSSLNNMKYKVNLSGLHCKGCRNLIKLSREEADFANVQVNPEKKTAMFETDNKPEEIKKILDKVFKDLKGYGYSNIVNDE